MDAGTYLEAFLALVIVIALIALVAYGVRRMGLTDFGQMARNGRRLRVVETLGLDARRRLVLIERDDRQHLVLIGGERDLVIETAITPPAEPAATVDRDSGTARAEGTLS